MFAISDLPVWGTIAEGSRQGANKSGWTKKQRAAYDRVGSKRKAAFSRRIGAQARAGRSRSTLGKIMP